MRVFSAGDFHGDSKLAEQIAKEAKKAKADVVILTGDLVTNDLNAENIIGHFKKQNLPLLFVPGNHESLATADFLAKLYDVKNIHGYSARYHDVGIFGCSGVNVGIHQLSDDEAFDLLKKGFDKIKYLSKKIMVTHVHPKDSKMEKFSQFLPGSKAIRKAIDEFKPDILLCSHVHEAHGLEEKIGNTKVINVGKKGKIIDI